MLTKYAVISDIHGLGDTFEALIEELKENDIKRFLFLGDFIGYGPQPIKVLDVVFKLIADGYEVYCVKGNHDAAIESISMDMDLQEISDTINFNLRAAASAYWTTKIIHEHPEAQKYVDFLLNLPEKLAVPNSSAFMVHGSYALRNSKHHYDPYLLDRAHWQEHIIEFKKDYPGHEKQVIFHGHTHDPSVVAGQKFNQFKNWWFHPYWDIGTVTDPSGVFDWKFDFVYGDALYVHNRNKKSCLSVNPGGGLPRNGKPGFFYYAIVTETENQIQTKWKVKHFCPNKVSLTIAEEIGDFEFDDVKVAKYITQKIKRGR